MHSANPHKSGYDIAALVQVIPELGPLVIQNKHGHDSIDFSNALAVKLLNRALLKKYHSVQYWDIPDGFLCPPIPGRLDYLCYLNEFLEAQGVNKELARHNEKVNALDIGTGANMIYALLGSQEFNWNVTGSDIEPISISWANELVKQNKNLKKSITLIHQPQKQHIFKGIIKEGDYFDITVCNPPFHASEEDAMAGSARKNKNLNRNKLKRGSQVSSIKHESQLNFAGRNNELWCEGGELSFIKNMIDESVLFAQQVGAFSCLVSKKENIAPLKKHLSKLKRVQHNVVDMKQGAKISRMIIWWFTG
mgnify:FL=1